MVDMFIFVIFYCTDGGCHFSNKQIATPQAQCEILKNRFKETKAPDEVFYAAASCLPVSLSREGMRI